MGRLLGSPAYASSAFLNEFTCRCARRTFALCCFGSLFSRNTKRSRSTVDTLYTKDNGSRNRHTKIQRYSIKRVSRAIFLSHTASQAVQSKLRERFQYGLSTDSPKAANQLVIGKVPAGSMGDSTLNYLSSCFYSRRRSWVAKLIFYSYSATIYKLIDLHNVKVVVSFSPSLWTLLCY